MALILLALFSLVLCIFFSGVQTSGAPIVVENTCIHNICEETQNYPYELASLMMELNPELQCGTNLYSNPIPSNEMNLCETEIKMFKPQAMLNVKFQQKFILQMGTCVQTLQVEICKHNATCLAENCIEKYQTYCREPMAIVKIITLDVDNKSMNYEEVLIPGGCICTTSSQ